MFSTSLLIVVFCGVLQESWTRYISLSVNLSLSLSDERPKLSPGILSSCMRETKLSMSELSRFHMSLLSNYPETMNSTEDGIIDGNVNENENEEDNILDYDETNSALLSERNDQSLECFAHCLYEQLGLIKNGVYMEHDLFTKLYEIVEREKHMVKECINMDSNNKCEASYKMHLCYSRLKSLEAERKIREILEYGDTGNNDMDENETEGDGDEVNDANAGNDGCDDNALESNPKANEIERT